MIEKLEEYTDSNLKEIGKLVLRLDTITERKESIALREWNQDTMDVERVNEEEILHIKMRLRFFGIRKLV